MKLTQLRLLIIILPLLSFGQQVISKSTDPNAQVIQKNVLRAIITSPMLPNREGLTLAFVLEHQLIGGLTLVGKVGTSIDIQDFGGSENPLRATINLYASIESRYFFTLNKRSEHGRPVRNFSGPYISLEQNIFSNPIALINQTKEKAFEGSLATFSNFGYQKQYKKFYLGVFFGVQLWLKDLTKDRKGRSLDGIHVGLSIGYVF